MPGNRAQIVAALGETRYADLLRFASESAVLLIGDGHARLGLLRVVSVQP